MSLKVASKIRRVQPSDGKSLARFFQENNRPEITKHFHPFALTLETAYQIVHTSHLNRHYIAIRDDRIVGFCMLRGWDEGFEVPSLGVLVDYRYNGCGLGKKMTEFAVSEAASLGCQSVRLSVYASNVRAVNIYSSLGFRELSREQCVLAGEADEKIVMIKDL